MTVAGVLLAAGAGSRYDGDGHKLRALIDDRTVLAHSLSAVLEAAVHEVVLVYGDDDYQDVIDTVGANAGRLITLHAPDWEQGQAHSLAVAIEHARSAGHDAIVVGLADQPLVGSSTWSGLAAADAQIAVANYGGNRRPPTRLGAAVWGRVPTTGDEGARQLLAEESANVADVLSAGWPDDVDTLDALDRVRQLYVDHRRTAELLGREPMGSFEVAVRNDDGDPVVLKNFPILADGRPMPTLYWLCGERESMLIGRLEAIGGVRQAEEAVGLDAVNATHERYRAERDQILDDAGLDVAHRPSGGVGGTRNGLKCLHAHYGYWLAGQEDPVGEWVSEHLSEVASPNWPATD